MHECFPLSIKIRGCHANQEFGGTVIQYETWKDVVEQSVRDPDRVLQALQDRERFDLVRDWIDVYGYPSHLRDVGRIGINMPLCFNWFVPQLKII